MVLLLVILRVKSLFFLYLIVRNSFICGFFVVTVVVTDVVLDKSLFCWQELKIKHIS